MSDGSSGDEERPALANGRQTASPAQGLGDRSHAPGAGAGPDGSASSSPSTAAPPPPPQPGATRGTSMLTSQLHALSTSQRSSSMEASRSSGSQPPRSHGSGRAEPQGPAPAAAAPEMPPMGAPPRQSLMIVSNRLPVNVSRDPATGHWVLPMSPGGLVSALLGVSQHSTRWVGWPGEIIDDPRERDTVTDLLVHSHHCIPVWMNRELLSLYYNGFCNGVLWQLFHYVPVQNDFKLSETHTLEQQWSAYIAANELFAEATLSDYKDGDVVWIQDYHLMLLPEMLKQRKPSMKVGFFLHTPFPSSEYYRTLPFREQLLRGVLKADLIGFHTYDYARHFISSCTRILGLEGTPYGVEENGTLIRVAAFPIGISPSKFTATLGEPDVIRHVEYLRTRYANLKVMLGVDRLDIIKGIPQKLLAFEKFLDEHPEDRQTVVLIQIAVPSRLDVPEYQHLRSQVHEIVGRINGKYGTLTHVPIHHLDRCLTFRELCALYSITDVALVTSLRDGMNLVSYEYVACQMRNHGVLVLSEFAGAAQSLGAGSILVNPWNINELSQAIYAALKMTPEERHLRWQSNYAHISVHTAQMWADHFITELNETCSSAFKRNTWQPTALSIPDAVGAYAQGRRRLIVIGYNAALTQPARPAQEQDYAEMTDTQVNKAKVNDQIFEAVCLLSADPETTIVISSGTTTAKLAEAFPNENVWLAAENGAYLRPPRALWDAFETAHEGSEWICLYENLNLSWVASVQQVFEYFSERTPRSVVETRSTSVVWNYRESDYEFGRTQAQDMLQHLLTGSISNSAVDVVRGSRSVEVRTFGVNKGVSMSRTIDLMARKLGPAAVAFDHVLCVGHFMSRDESIFAYFEGEDVKKTSRNRGGPAFDSRANPERGLLYINPFAHAAPDPAARRTSASSHFAATPTAARSGAPSLAPSQHEAARGASAALSEAARFAAEQRRSAEERWHASGGASPAANGRSGGGAHAAGDAAARTLGHDAHRSGSSANTPVTDAARSIFSMPGRPVSSERPRSSWGQGVEPNGAAAHASGANSGRLPPALDSFDVDLATQPTVRQLREEAGISFGENGWLDAPPRSSTERPRARTPDPPPMVPAASSIAWPGVAAAASTHVSWQTVESEDSQAPVHVAPSRPSLEDVVQSAAVIAAARQARAASGAESLQQESSNTSAETSSLTPRRPQTRASIQSSLHEPFLPPESLFTINVGRSRSVARFCVDGPKQVALLLSALCGISLPSQSFESLSQLESGCLDAIQEIDGASGGGTQPDAMVWDGARVRSRESFDPSGGRVSATEVTKIVRPQSTQSIDIQQQASVSHVDSAASLVHSLADICDSYDNAIAAPPVHAASLLGGPAIASSVLATDSFSMHASASQDQVATGAGASGSGEESGISPPMPPPAEIAGTSTLFDAVGRPVLMPQVAQDPLMSRSRRGPHPHRGTATCSHSAAEMSRASFEPMYERDDDADALAWRRGGGSASGPGAVGAGGGRMRSSRTETNLKSLAGTLPMLRASCELPRTAYASARPNMQRFSTTHHQSIPEMPALEVAATHAPASRPSAGWPPLPPQHASRASLNGVTPHLWPHASYSSGGSAGNGSMTSQSTMGTSALQSRGSGTSGAATEAHLTAGECLFVANGRAGSGGAPVLDKLGVVQSHAVLDAELSREECEVQSGGGHGKRGGLHSRLIPDRHWKGA